MSNQVQMIKTLPDLSISTFDDIAEQIDAGEDAALPEIYYRSAIRTAEATFGAYHGEVGLILGLLADYYRSNGRPSDAGIVDGRIADIVALYQHDQMH